MGAILGIVFEATVTIERKANTKAKVIYKLKFYIHGTISCYRVYASTAVFCWNPRLDSVTNRRIFLLKFFVISTGASFLNRVRSFGPIHQIFFVQYDVRN